MADPKKKVDCPPDVNCGCASAIEALACAAGAVAAMQGCCAVLQHQAGRDCCAASMGLILDAMQMHLDCLRSNCCPPGPPA